MVGGGGFRVFWGVLPVFGGVFTRGWCDSRFGAAVDDFTAVLTVDLLSPLSCSTQVAYVGGSLGALIGADLMNWRRLPELGAPVVSLGGAGTFDGIYITGLVSVLLVLLLI